MENNSPDNQMDARSSSSAELERSTTTRFIETDSMSTEWTDEKHSLYIKSIEASFVNQLYDSLDCHKQHMQSPSSSKALYKPPKHCPSNGQMRSTASTKCSPFGQFKVLRKGFWHEANFSRPGFQRKEVDGCRCFLTSPWVNHFKSASKLHGETVSVNNNGTKSCAPAADIHKSSQCCSYVKFGGGNANAVEVSDQNFVDEEDEGEAAGESSMNGGKRKKTMEGGTPSADQVVPFDRPHLNDVPKTCASPGG
ncbi:hypothetical protein SAY87_031522 [Trapa incisa]|uniref:Uncharacterized protein n=1 Tax=Trapa incisa TaxID=236973 RepID=A0AAN7QPS9_9MYRT|nr:hypothetical protein SAY87_031522 [Trapa incisa]